MPVLRINAIAAVFSVATVASCCFFTSCEGRRMSNMEPIGETVEVNVPSAEAEYVYTTDFGGDIEMAPVDSLSNL